MNIGYIFCQVLLWSTLGWLGYLAFPSVFHFILAMPLWLGFCLLMILGCIMGVKCTPDGYGNTNIEIRKDIESGQIKSLRSRIGFGIFLLSFFGLLCCIISTFAGTGLVFKLIVISLAAFFGSICFKEVKKDEKDN